MREIDKMLHRVAAVATAVLAIATVSGCAGISPIGRTTTEENCVTRFEVHENPQPLGSSEKFRRAATELADAGTASTTLGEVAQKAGWRGTWDRMLPIDDSATSNDINAMAGTSGICFLGIHESDPDSGTRGWYIFFNGQQPVQSMYWDWYSGFVRLDRDAPSTVQRDEPLTASTEFDPPELVTTTGGG